MPTSTTPDGDPRRRLGVYVAPRGDSPLGGRAARWLGRHIDPRPTPAPAEVALDAEQLWELTAEPRLYGFHATIKPPFHLAPGADASDLDAAVARLAAGLEPVVLPALELHLVRGFAALVPAEEDLPLLAALERTCVVELEPFRRPADEIALARRRRADLTDRQDELLLAYGYPWVLDEFDFHMTLTRRLHAAEVEPVLEAAASWFDDDLAAPLVIDELCVVEQPSPGEPFVVVTRHALGGLADGSQR